HQMAPQEHLREAQRRLALRGRASRPGSGLRAFAIAPHSTAAAAIDWKALTAIWTCGPVRRSQDDWRIYVACWLACSARAACSRGHAFDTSPIALVTSLDGHAQDDLADVTAAFHHAVRIGGALQRKFGVDGGQAAASR